MTDTTRMFIPGDRLPPGFADRLDAEPETVAVPKPASTIVLLRDADAGLEVLLLRRHRSTGFVPGAWVFAGGRVDQADDDPRLWTETAVPQEPPPAYWAAAVRELFEETGVLLARDAHGRTALDAADPDLRRWRDALLDDRATLLELLADRKLRIDIDDVVPCAHWITPAAEPRRYDTRFFLAAMPAGRVARLDEREMTDAVWLSPRAALDRFARGQLPMVFPTVRTLESLAPYHTTAAAIAAFRGRPVSPVLPRLVRTGGGVALVLDEPDVRRAGEP